MPSVASAIQVLELVGLEFDRAETVLLNELVRSSEGVSRGVETVAPAAFVT